MRVVQSSLRRIRYGSVKVDMMLLVLSAMSRRRYRRFIRYNSGICFLSGQMLIRLSEFILGRRMVGQNWRRFRGSIVICQRRGSRNQRCRLILRSWNKTYFSTKMPFIPVLWVYLWLNILGMVDPASQAVHFHLHCWFGYLKLQQMTALSTILSPVRLSWFPHPSSLGVS